MARESSLATMSIDSLLELRDKVGMMLSQKTTDLRRQLERLDGTNGSRRVHNANGSARRGRKLAPKYRDPDDTANVWAGRGARPRWMEARIRAGSRQNFLIGSADHGRKKSVAKGTAQAKRAKTNGGQRRRAV
jgi:DNA-binding protein H-NS